MDGQCLVSIFKRLGFEIALYYGDVSLKEAQIAINRKVSNMKQADKDMFAICIISQGGDKDIVEFSDGNRIQLSQLLAVRNNYIYIIRKYCRYHY